ncbi:12069_t:CDS:2 [Racocetra fulgida]|uniref:12069_t:CDS:1 n=1 Tax=Racocetra fulgida TaxID=60492 RepID=A0A9N8WE16_9GLOM|nr:12069_t:CDS:2 [Racocetra fulgida]
MSDHVENENGITSADDLPAVEKNVPSFLYLGATTTKQARATTTEQARLNKPELLPLNKPELPPPINH